MSVFKAYDIRGLHGSEIDTDLAHKIGLAYAAEIKPQRVLVGHDMRPVAPRMRDALVAGLRTAGVDVVDCGLCSTPMHSFGVGHGDFDGGIMVTASHNPAEYIGFKLCRKLAVPLSGEQGIGAMEARIRRGDLPEAGYEGALRSGDFTEAYVDMVIGEANFGRKLKIVADAGNGMGGFEFSLVAPRLDLELVPLYFTPDGTFPNHEANPLNVATLEELRARVLQEKADFGVAFDGDADRAAFIDEKGDVVTNDLATALMAIDILEREKGPVVYDVRCSRVVDEEIREHGGMPIKSRVGHSFMKAAMRERRCVFGGEYSGHYYFPRNFNTESASLAVVAMGNIVSRAETGLAGLLKPLRRYRQTGEINFRVREKEAKMRELEEAFPDADIDRLDGVTISYPGWWCNVRPSNTEPYLRLNLEACDPEDFKKARQKVFAILGEPV